MKLGVILLATIILVIYFAWKENKQKKDENDRWGDKR